MDDIDRADVITIDSVNLSPDLPAYDARANAYMEYVLARAADVIMVHGLRVGSTVLDAAGAYSAHVGDDHGMGFVNATLISSAGRIVGSKALQLSARLGGRTVILAPDCLVDQVYFNRRPVRLYNMENVAGPFFEAQRTFVVETLARDSYLTHRRATGHDDDLMYMAADMHALPGADSMRLLTGLTSRKGVPPSAWSDVWGELRHGEPGYTDRGRDVFNADIVLPAYVRQHRRSYMMAYGDLYGRVGSPVSVDIMGMKSTANDIPFSGTYGLTMSVYVPRI